MKRIANIVLLFFVLLVFSSCTSTGSSSSLDSGFDKQFSELGAAVWVQGDNVALQDDVYGNIVLNAKESWVLNLNGHTIYGTVEVLKGSLALVNGNADPYKGGIENPDGVCLVVGRNAKVQIDSGTYIGRDYAIELQKDAVLYVLGGHFSGSILPISVPQAWGGSLAGGVFSAYDEDYDQAILGDCYASVRFKDEDKSFASGFEKPFTIARKGTYSGVSSLKLGTTGGLLARFRLYKTYLTDSYLDEEVVKPSYEWVMYPGQSEIKNFEAGSYVLKVAEGYDWTDEDGFGEEGIYWCMEPFDFLDSHIYGISTHNGKATHKADTLEGFLTGSENLGF